MKVKSVEVKINYLDGISLSSVYVPPNLRKKRNPKSPFKEMECDIVEWFKQCIKL
jgi:hypothetical protein